MIWINLAMVVAVLIESMGRINYLPFKLYIGCIGIGIKHFIVSVILKLNYWKRNHEHIDN